MKVPLGFYNLSGDYLWNSLNQHLLSSAYVMDNLKREVSLPTPYVPTALFLRLMDTYLPAFFRKNHFWGEVRRDGVECAQNKNLYSCTILLFPIFLPLVFCFPLLIFGSTVFEGSLLALHLGVAPRYT